MSNVGRISGPLLKANLERKGIDLAFETDLLYLDVQTRRVGIRKNNPTTELQVTNSGLRTVDIIADFPVGVNGVTFTTNNITSSNNSDFIIESPQLINVPKPKIQLYTSGGEDMLKYADTYINLHRTYGMYANNYLIDNSDINTDITNVRTV